MIYRKGYVREFEKRFGKEKYRMTNEVFEWFSIIRDVGDGNVKAFGVESWGRRSGAGSM